MTKQEGLKKLVEDWGFESEDAMLEKAVIDSCVPAICLKCGYSTEMEPDQTRGWCEECNKGSCVSCLILAGII